MSEMALEAPEKVEHLLIFGKCFILNSVFLSFFDALWDVTLEQRVNF